MAEAEKGGCIQYIGLEIGEQMHRHVRVVFPTGQFCKRTNSNDMGMFGLYYFDVEIMQAYFLNLKIESMQYAIMLLFSS